ncbi:MAG TPA: cyclase family protein [Anaerolineaceae bacterium]
MTFTKSDERQGLIDVSHVVEDGLITYKGLPAPVICDYLSREESRSHYSGGAEFYIGKIEMVANTGTYVDSPFHRFADGKDLSELALASLANLDGIVIRVSGRDVRAVSLVDLIGVDVRGKAVWVHTGWDSHWKTDQYLEGHPYLTRDAALAEPVLLNDAHNVRRVLGLMDRVTASIATVQPRRTVKIRLSKR